MKDFERVAEGVGMLLGAEIEIYGGKCTVSKKRTLEIEAEAVCFSCTLELDISFERYQENGFALNKAEVFLLPGECQEFTLALLQCNLPLPSMYRQWQVENPKGVSLYLESVEPPLDFAGRLSTAFQAIDQSY